MRDNRKCIAISLPASTWSHCFVGIEVKSGSVYVFQFYFTFLDVLYSCEMYFLGMYFLEMYFLIKTLYVNVYNAHLVQNPELLSLDFFLQMYFQLLDGCSIRNILFLFLVYFELVIFLVLEQNKQSFAISWYVAGWEGIGESASSLD